MKTKKSNNKKSNCYNIKKVYKKNKQKINNNIKVSSHRIPSSKIYKLLAQGY